MKKHLQILIYTLLSVVAMYGQAEPMKLTMSPDAGLYSGSVRVSITCNYPNASIYYTTNGTAPSTSANRYSNPLFIDTTCVLFAIAYFQGKSCTEIATYVFGMDSTKIAVSCITIEPAQLFDPITGLWVLGPRGSRSFPHVGANWNSDREVKAHWEFFESDHKQAFEGDYAFRVFGGFSRMLAQKSFAMTAREEKYGLKRIDYPIFPDQDIKRYKGIVFRNSGSDFGSTQFRDAMITSLGADMGLEVQAYRPCHTFINGKYWGIYNLREKLNRFYIEDHTGYDADSVDLLEHNAGTKAGSKKHYTRMQTYMREHDLSVQSHFDTVASMMDVNNFMEYQIIEIFIENHDAGGNIKFWRPQKPDGKWRWILFDTDFGFGQHGKDKAIKFNSLEFHTEPNGPGWPNPPWSTFNLRMLLKNDGFRDAFILRFADRLNSTLSPQHAVKRIRKMQKVLEPEIPYHQKRWKYSLEDWYNRVDRMCNFAEERPKYIRQYLREMFPHIGEEVKLQIQIDSGGYVVVNGVFDVNDKTWQGVYFKNLPVALRARPKAGYVFSHWEDQTLKINDRELNVKFNDTIKVLKAVFIRGEHPLAKSCVINEISCRDSTAGDWVEFFNTTNQTVDLTGWRLRDKNENEFVFPAVQLKGNDFLVLCRDKDRFLSVFPKVSAANVLGGLNFGFGSKKERIELYDNNDDLVNAAKYKIEKEFDGQLVSLSLRDPYKENSDEKNWKIMNNAGSPASANPNYIEESKQQQTASLLKYVKIGGIALAAFLGIVGIYMVARKRMRRRV